jgi:hypothetical protein
MTQVCRFEYRVTTSRDQICGLDLYMVDGTVITLYYGDAGFERVAEELNDQGFNLSLGPTTTI